MFDIEFVMVPLATTRSSLIDKDAVKVESGLAQLAKQILG